MTLEERAATLEQETVKRDALVEWMGEIRERLNQQDAKIDHVIARVDGVYGRLDGIEQTLSVIKAVVLGEDPTRP